MREQIIIELATHGILEVSNLNHIIFERFSSKWTLVKINTFQEKLKS